MRTIEDLIRETLQDSQQRPKLTAAQKIAALHDLKSRCDAPCPFAIGDLVTPRDDSHYKDAGEPHLVIEVEETPAPFLGCEPTSNQYGARFDIRVAGFCNRGPARLHWVESVFFRAYDDAAPQAAAPPSS